MARGGPLLDQRLAALEIDEQDRLSRLRGQKVAIAPLERRAGPDGDALMLGRLVQGLREGREPRPAVIVVERSAGPHLLLVGLGVVIVAVEERGVEAAGNRLAGAGLAAGRNALGDQDTGGNEAQNSTL